MFETNILPRTKDRGLSLQQERDDGRVSSEQEEEEEERSCSPLTQSSGGGRPENVSVIVSTFTQ